jgi:hypothetical protein
MSVAGAKSFGITKREVWDAYKRVKANRGAAGVDGVSIADFDRELRKNLYRIWNRMASGSYFPPPVKRGLSRILCVSRLLKSVHERKPLAELYRQL